MEEPREPLLNYVPLEKMKDQRSGFRQLISGCLKEFSAFWSFFWRWLLLYSPIWALLMLLYLNLAQSG